MRQETAPVRVLDPVPSGEALVESLGGTATREDQIKPVLSKADVNNLFRQVNLCSVMLLVMRCAVSLVKGEQNVYRSVLVAGRSGGTLDEHVCDVRSITFIFEAPLHSGDNVGGNRTCGDTYEFSSCRGREW